MVMVLATSRRSSARDRFSWGVRARAAARTLAALCDAGSEAAAEAKRGSMAFMTGFPLTRGGGRLPPVPTGWPPPPHPRRPPPPPPSFFLFRRHSEPPRRWDGGSPGSGRDGVCDRLGLRF